MDLNPRGENIFGLCRENVIGKPYTKLGLPNSIQMNVNKSKLIQDELNPLVETTITRTDGETKHLEVTASSIMQNEAPSKNLLTVRDVTERKKLQTSLISSERLAAVGRLATIIAHDLRNPLQSISAATYVIKRTTQQTRDEKTISALESISDAVKYSDKIIRGLLDYSADITLEITKTDPQTIINHAMSGITVPNRIKVIDRTQSNPKVYADLDRIKVVIVNLVTNAFEAMPKGGTLTIVSKERNSGLELIFEDTGTGIPKGKMEKLWTPFVTTKAKGMGLGLPICKRIVEAHGGQILVDSETGKGTTFTLVLPTKAPEKNNVEFLVRERSSYTELFENCESLASTSILQQEKEAGGI
jgi:PAS domain S-box-containing protein